MDELYEELSALIRPCMDRGERSFYVLIDHSALPGLLSFLTTQGIEWISLFEGSGEEGALAVAPILVILSPNISNMRQRVIVSWMLKRARYRTALSFLVSSEDQEFLVEGLRLRLDAIIQDDIQIMLRYFDTRTFEALMAVLTSEQKKSFISIVDSWLFLDRRGNLRYEKSIDGLAQLSVDLSFTPSQEMMMVRMSYPDQVERYLQTLVPNMYIKIPENERPQFIWDSIQLASGYEFELIEDYTFFAILQLTLGDDFHNKPGWASAFANLKKKRRPLREIAVEVDQDIGLG